MRPGSEAPGDRIGRRPDLVRLQLFEYLALSPQDALVGPEELVCRAHQEITADRLHVRYDMRRTLHGIDKSPCAGVARLVADGRYVVDRAGEVARTAAADESRLFVKDTVQQR